MAEQNTYLTTAGLDKLKAELKGLKEERRPAVIARIKEAVAYGDLSENSEYEDSKNEQALVEGRIAELERLLENPQIVKPGKSSNGEVALGSKVTVKHGGSSTSYTIVGPAEADPAGGLISNESPIGQALLGKGKGDEAVVETPKGNVKYTIVSLS
ncbi:MAG TPA: transcription elongation factor GreA [Patescibacteria group bacterium]|jgi:transcription elongation factor GreA